MKFLPMPPNQLGATHKVIVEHTDVAAVGAAASGAIALFDVIAGSYVKCLGANLVTPFDFSDSGITSLLGEVGETDTDRLFPQTEWAVDGTEILFKTGQGAASDTGYAFNAADTVDLTLTAANGGSPLLSECNAGKVELYFIVLDLNELERAQ